MRLTSSNMMDDASDHWLIERAITGDATAFARLLERHYDVIHRVAYRWTGNVEDAEDIAQDVCIKLGTALATYRRESAFTSWLFRITLNAVRDRQRKQKRDAAQLESVAHLAEAATPPLQEQTSEVHDLWSAVRQLPERQRDAVLLVYAEELSHAEAAAALGCAEKTVSWQLHAARKKLKGLLEPSQS
ncbi:MAG: RNA polymerase sigma factor [Pseudomonadota bacterium]